MEGDRHDSTSRDTIDIMSGTLKREHRPDEYTEHKVDPGEIPSIRSSQLEDLRLAFEKGLNLSDKQSTNSSTKGSSPFLKDFPEDDLGLRNESVHEFAPSLGPLQLDRDYEGMCCISIQYLHRLY